MHYTQNQKIEQVTEATLVVGVDIGSRKQYARAFDWRGVELGHVFSFMDCRDGYELFLKWIQNLQTVNAKGQVMVGMEPTGHYWFGLRDFLQHAGIPLVLVNPLHVKQSKELDDNSQTKNDQKDPKVIARLVMEGRYSVPYIPHGVYAELRGIWPLRQRLVERQIALKNRFARWFRIYFPEYLEAYGSFEGKSSMALLAHACLPEDLLSLGQDGIVHIWRAMKLRAVGKRRAQTLLDCAKRSIGQKDGAVAARMEMKMLLQEWKLCEEELEEVMLQIESLLQEIPESAKLMAIKGIGLATVAGFFAEVGDVRRFRSPKQILKLAGLSLRENSSGKHKGRTTISKRGRARLRMLIFNAVIPLLSRNEEFRKIHQYYTTRKVNPLKKKQSVIAVGSKLIRVFFAILTKGCRYDATKMLDDIHRQPPAA